LEKDGPSVRKAPAFKCNPAFLQDFGDPGKASSSAWVEDNIRPLCPQEDDKDFQVGIYNSLFLNVPPSNQERRAALLASMLEEIRAL